MSYLLRGPMTRHHTLKSATLGAFTIGLLVSLPAAAETWSPDYRKIAHVYPHSTGVSFILDGPVIDASSPCPNRFVLTLGMPNYAVIVAGLYSMHAQGKRIQINYDELNHTCDIPVNRFQSEN